MTRLTSLKMCGATALLACASAAYGKCNSEEVGYVASFKVKAGSEAAFEQALINLAETVVRVESGVVLYAPFKGADGRYFMMERYADAAAREAHGKSPEVGALFPALGPHLAGAPDVQPVSAICPQAASGGAPAAPTLGTN